MDVVFFTGFPGFLGTELLPRVLKRRAGARAVCLVQPRYSELARQRAATLALADPSLANRIDIIEGDITVADLGIPSGEDLSRYVVEIYHLAAVYDLSVGRDFAMRVNVEGTRNLIAFARRCSRLQRFHYISTCYVSGRYDGVFTEDDLVKGQTFNNFYEETKYLAEVDVQQAMREGLPSTIYRPAVVVGDSTTGATQKYDGPYFVIQWILRQPGIALMPVVGNSRQFEFNVVPRDFVVDSIVYLSGSATSLGKVYQLADPGAPTVDAMLRDIERATGKRMLRLPLPRSVAKFSIDHVPGVYRLMKIPSSAVDYFVHPTRYRTPATERDLAASGIRVPHFGEYVEKLVEFHRAHPEIGAAAMV